MANSVDPDQTDLGLHCLHNYASLSDTLTYEMLGHLPYGKKMGSLNISGCVCFC